MFIIFNEDGSRKISNFTDYIMQGSNLVNFIDVAIEGKSVEEWSCSGIFTLPQSSTITIQATVQRFEIDGKPYHGYRIPLTEEVTRYSGQVGLNIVAVNSLSQVLVTYTTNLTVNQTGYPLDDSWDNAITVAEYNSLMAQLTTYQLKYLKSNVRGYENNIDDLEQLATGQIVAVHNNSNNQFWFYKKLEGGTTEKLEFTITGDQAILVEKTLTPDLFYTKYSDGDVILYQNKLYVMSGTTATDFLFGYIRTENLRISGHTITNIEEQSQIDITNGVALRYNGQQLLVDDDRVTVYATNGLYVYSNKVLTDNLVGQPSGLASLDSNGQVPLTEIPNIPFNKLPSSLFGAMIYGGTIATTTGRVTPTSEFVNKYNITSDVIINANNSNTFEGVYFIAVGAGGTFGHITDAQYQGFYYKPKDFIVSQGSAGYALIDNQQAILSASVSGDTLTINGVVGVQDDTLILLS